MKFFSRREKHDEVGMSVLFYHPSSDTGVRMFKGRLWECMEQAEKHSGKPIGWVEVEALDLRSDENSNFPFYRISASVSEIKTGALYRIINV
jgi:hypothetical protein